MEFKNTNQARRPMVGLVVVAALLQLLIAPHIAILGGRFNFMVALVAAISISADPALMVYIGFGAGLFFDLTSSAPIGLMALILTVSAYLLSTMSRGIAPGFDVNAFRLSVVFVFIINIVYSVALLLLGVESSFVAALTSQGIISSILDIIAVVPFLMVGGAGSTGYRSPRAGRRGGTRFKGIR